MTRTGPLHDLISRVDALTGRERLVVLCAGVIVLTVGWYALLGEQTIAQRERLDQGLSSIEQRLAGLESAATAQQDSSGAQDTVLQKRLDQLRERAVVIEGMIEDYAAELISPTEMAQVLEIVLAGQTELRLKRLGNLGAEDLLSDESSGLQHVYRHRFEMELEGPYLDCLAYLEDLEELPWRLYWQVLEIDADDYPINRIHIEVATLSLHREWIGV